MIYLVVGVLLAGWVLLDARKRELGAWQFIHPLLTVFFWPLALPLYNAGKPLVGSEKREGGKAYNTLRGLILLWTLLMIVWAISGIGVLGQSAGNIRTDAQAVGFAIGGSIGIGILCVIWGVVTVILLVLMFVLKKPIIEEADTT